MATHVPMSTPRQPFAELSGQRLQHLTSLKNRQNGMLSSPLTNTKSPLSNVTNASPLSTLSKKRAYEPTPEIFEDIDSENVDPRVFLSPSKKTKPSTTFTFTKPAPVNVSLLRKAITPITPRANMSSPRAPNTAPAGRSPPRKTRPLDSKRRVSAPYTRIDPPSSHRKSTRPEIPFFSLEEALSGKLSTPAAKSVAPASSAAVELNKGIPKAWYFTIHEDTPQQEAENLMEHSTHLLDISSDEEGALSKAADKGKENIAPLDFEVPAAAAQVPAPGRKSKGKKVQRRRKVVKPDEMDDGERTPLSEVEREDFFPEGVKDGEVVIVDGEKEEKIAVVTTAASSNVASASAVDVKGDILGDIVIFEDNE